MMFNASIVASISMYTSDVIVADSFYLISTGIVLSRCWQMGGQGNHFPTSELLKK